MCVVSMVGDFYQRQIPDKFPYQPWTIWPDATVPAPGVSQQEFQRLKEMVEEMLDLMRKAAEIDRKTGQPDCQTDDKLALLRQIAATVGVDLDKEIGAANGKA